MRRNDGFGWFHALLVVGAWRALSELLQRRRELRGTGALGARLAARRAARIERGLADAGLAPSPEPVLAAVHVGGVESHDVDDVALLEGSMQRVTRSARPAVAAAPATDWGRLLEDEREPTRVRTREVQLDLDADRSTVPAWAPPLVVVGVGLTAWALVRPLADASPWLAGAGLALALAGWVAARRG